MCDKCIAEVKKYDIIELVKTSLERKALTTTRYSTTRNSPV